MSALLIGFLLVVVSAAAFGAAIFGRRPIPQAATPYVPDGGGAEEAPSLLRGGQLTVARVAGVGSPVLIRPPEDPGHIAQGRVRVPGWVRLRSAIVLAVATVGGAVLIGAMLAVVVVGAVLLVAH